MLRVHVARPVPHCYCNAKRPEATPTLCPEQTLVKGSCVVRKAQGNGLCAEMGDQCTHVAMKMKDEAVTFMDDKAGSPQPLLAVW